LLPKSIPTLDGKKIKLLPLEQHHATRLFEIADGQNIWRWFPFAMNDPKIIEEQVKIALEDFKAGKALPFVMFDKKSNTIVGTSRFSNISIQDRRVEIGNTWIGPKWQGTGVNLEAKYLMFKFAFEVLKCIRVELKTDMRNLHSQNAMKSVGLVREGVLRSHIITHEGYYRDSVYFSVIEKDWPKLKQDMEKRIAETFL